VDEALSLYFDKFGCGADLPRRGLTPIRVGVLPISARRDRLSDLPVTGLEGVALDILLIKLEARECNRYEMTMLKFREQERNQQY
jgi:hypothetical protein